LLRNASGWTALVIGATATRSPCRRPCRRCAAAGTPPPPSIASCTVTPCASCRSRRTLRTRRLYA